MVMMRSSILLLFILLSAACSGDRAMRVQALMELNTREDSYHASQYVDGKTPEDRIAEDFESLPHNRDDSQR